jgi:protein gp37
MSKVSGVDWCDSSVSFWMGCSKVSRGCLKCYAEREMEKFGRIFNNVERSSITTFKSPLKWKEPKVIFVNPWSDFFHAKADEWRNDAWDIIRRCPHHTWLILTKRTDRILSNLPDDWDGGWDNVWLGTSLEDGGPLCSKRLQNLLKVDHKNLFLSCEPLLGYVVLYDMALASRVEKIGWIIAGGETGNDSRQTHPWWVKSLLEQSEKFNIPFFFKGWGEYAPYIDDNEELKYEKVGKKKSGKMLYGKEYEQTPWNYNK